eukprot:86374_1
MSSVKSKQSICNYERTSKIPVLAYAVEGIIHMVFGIFMTFNKKHYYYNMIFFAYALMAPGRCFIKDTTSTPEFKPSSLSYIVNEMGSYWIILSFFMPYMVDMGYITDFNVYYSVFVAILPIIFASTLNVGWHWFNVFNKLIGIIVGILSNIFCVYKYFTDMDTKTKIFQNKVEVALFAMYIVLYLIAAVKRMSKSERTQRTYIGRWIWNLSVAFGQFFHGLIGFARD